MVVLISYDLKKPGKDYKKLYEGLKEIGTEWWHYLESVWLLETHLTPDQISASLRPHMDNNDSLFVITLRPSYDGWLPEDAWNWLRAKSF